MQASHLPVHLAQMGHASLLLQDPCAILAGAVCGECAQRDQLNGEGAWTCIWLPAAGHAPDGDQRTCFLRRPDCAAVGWPAAQQHAQIQQTSLAVER